MTEHFSTNRRRKAKVGVALAVGLGLLVVPTAMPASADSTVHASAQTGATISGTALAGMGADDPAALIGFQDNLGVVVRTPAIEATEAQAAARNIAGSEPTLTCYEGVTTTGPAALAAPVSYSGLGEYTSYEGALVLNFYMEQIPTSAVDACVMTGTDFMPSPAKFVFTAAGSKAVYGDPKTLEASAKTELTKIKNAAAKIYAESGSFPMTNPMRDQLRKSLNNQKIFIRPTREFVGAAAVPHLIRSEMTASKLVASVRLADSRLVTLSYDGEKNKASFNTTPLTFASATAPMTTTAKSKAAVKAQRVYGPANYFVKSGVPSYLFGAAVTGYPSDKKVFASVRTSRGTLSVVSVRNPDGSIVARTVEEATKAGTTLGYGYTSYSGAEIGFYGSVEAVNGALTRLFVTVPRLTAEELKTPTTITLSAFEHRDDIAFNPANQHFYKFVSGQITGTAAFADVLKQKEFGLQGYMASITDAAENDFVTAKIPGATNVWIGATDSEAEGTWKWTGGPDVGKQFWKGNCSAVDGSAFEGGYAKWATGEPNNWLDVVDPNNPPNRISKECGGNSYDPAAGVGEDCVVTNWSTSRTPEAERLGHWNDLPCSIDAAWDGAPGRAKIAGYVAEFGNKPVGGDFSGVDIASVNLMTTPPDPIAVVPNFFQKAAKFLKSAVTPKSKAQVTAKRKIPATWDVKLRVQLNRAGKYVLYFKRPDGRGVPFEVQKGTWTRVGKSFKRDVLQKPEWTVNVTTKKDNEIITVNAVLRTDGWAKPGGVKTFFSLVAPAKAAKNLQCLANWCQSQTLPVPKTAKK